MSSSPARKREDSSVATHSTYSARRMTSAATKPQEALARSSYQPDSRTTICRVPLAQGFWAVLEQGTFAASNFVLNLLLARWMSPKDYGVFGVAFSIFMFLGVLHTAFFTEPMLIHGPSGKYRPVFSEYLRILVRWHFQVSLAASVALLATAVGLVYLDQPGMSSSLMGLAFATPPIFLLWLGRRACYVLLRPSLAASSGLLYFATVIAGAAILSKLQWLSSVSTFIAMGTGSLISSVWLFRRILVQGDPHEGVSRAEVAKDHFETGRWVVPSSILHWTTGNVAVFLLPWWWGYEAVATLKALTNLIMPIPHTIVALSTLLIPNLVQSKGTRQFESLVNRGAVAFLVIAAVCAIPLVLFARPVLGWAYGGKYDEAARWLPFVALSAILPCVSSAFNCALRANDRVDLVFRAKAVSTATIMILALPLIQYGGIRGAILSILIASAVDAGMQYRLGRRVMTPVG